MGDNSDLAGANPMGEMLNFEEKDAFAEVNTAAGLGSTNKVSQNNTDYAQRDTRMRLFTRK